MVNFLTSQKWIEDFLKDLFWIFYHFFFFGFDSRYGLFSNFTPSTNDTFPFSVIYDISMPSKVLNKDLKNIENRHSDGKWASTWASKPHLVEELKNYLILLSPSIAQPYLKQTLMNLYVILVSQTFNYRDTLVWYQ